MNARFTMPELLQWLSMEITRADTDFRRSQSMANAAMWRDLVPSDERIAVSWLEVSEMTLDFSLIPVEAEISTRLLHWLWRLTGVKSKGDILQHYQFSADQSASMRISVAVKRDAGGKFKALDKAA
jgi:hypothetical protein